MTEKAKTILLIDNSRRFALNCASFLQRAGYTVTLAFSYEEALHYLRHGWFHLAIIDWRMKDESDEDDSGYELAKTAPYPLLKILQTHFMEYSIPKRISNEVMDLGHFKMERYNILTIVDKEKELEYLLETVDIAFKYRKFSWDLRINPPGYRPDQIVDLIGEDLVAAEELDITRKDIRDCHESELDDLFHMLFHDQESISILSILWHSQSRVGLLVEVSGHRQEPTIHLVTLGRHATAFHEQELSNEIGITRRSLNRPTTWVRFVETSHYGANLYEFIGLEPHARLASLRQRKETGEVDLLENCLDTLRGDQFPPWHPETYPYSDQAVGGIFHQLAFSSSESLQSLFAEKVQNLSKSLSAYGHKIILKNGKLIVHLNNKVPHTFSDPFEVQNLRPAHELNPHLRLAPGHLELENLLSDSHANVWLTNLFGTTEAPLSWIPANIEALARYDLCEGQTLEEMFSLEELLAPSEKPNLCGKLPETESELSGLLSGYDPKLHLPIRQAWRTRHWANCMYQPDEYHLALYYQAARRLFRYQPHLHDDRAADRIRFAHLLISMAMLADHFSHLGEIDRESLWFQGDSWYYGKVNLELGPVIGKILSTLYESRNTIVTKDKLTRAIGNILSNKITERQNIYQHITRLRQKLSEVSGEPGAQWIWTIRGQGYCLSIPPRPKPGTTQTDD